MNDAGSASDAGHDGGMTSTSDAGSLISDPFDPAAAASALAQAFCAYRSRCEPAFHDFLGENEATCTANALGLRTDLHGVYDAMIRAGRLRFIQSAFDACLGTLENSDCVLGIDDACTTMFAGTLEVGVACSFAEECADDGWCEAPSSGRCGTCRAPFGQSQDCTVGTCARGFECVPAGPRQVCVSNTASEDDPCGTVATGFCVGRLQCVGPTDTRTCQRPAAAGTACDASGTSRAYCSWFQNSTCVNGTCGTTNWVGNGTSCEPPNRCTAGGTCNPTTTTCEPWPGFAEPCTGVCADGLFCFRSQCVLERTEGEMCEAAGDCRDDLWCVSGVCGALTYATCP